MKNLLLLLFCLPAMAQVGYKTEGNHLVWQGTFSAESANISVVLDRIPNIEMGAFMDNMLKGKVTDLQNTCTSGTALMKNNIKFDFIILTDPYGYTVKVKNVKFLEKYGPMQSRTMANGWEKYFMDESKMKTDATSQQNMGCLNNFFTAMFSPAPQAEATAMTAN